MFLWITIRAAKKWTVSHILTLLWFEMNAIEKVTIQGQHVSVFWPVLSLYFYSRPTFRAD